MHSEFTVAAHEIRSNRIPHPAAAKRRTQTLAGRTAGA